jgi:hypothetical protein
MVSPFLGWEFASFFDEIPELGLPSLEFAALVIGCYPVGDFVCCLLFIRPSSRIAPCSALTIFVTLLVEKNALKTGFDDRLRVADRVMVLMSIKERIGGQLRLFYAPRWWG